jgi:hypothetical protein
MSGHHAPPGTSRHYSPAYLPPTPESTNHRYLFVNQSADIHRLCGQTLDRLGVAWRFSKPTTISVARREAVARLDVFVGPKY